MEYAQATCAFAIAKLENSEILEWKFLPNLFNEHFYTHEKLNNFIEF